MLSLNNSKRPLLQVATLAALTALICRMHAGQPMPPVNWTVEQDHQNMMDQLEINALRPGPSGNEKDTNHANYGAPQPTRDPAAAH